MRCVEGVKPVLVSEGAEGEVNPRRSGRETFKFGCPLTTLLVCAFRLGYLGFPPLVRSLNVFTAFAPLLLPGTDTDARAGGRACSKAAWGA